MDEHLGQAPARPIPIPASNSQAEIDRHVVAVGAKVNNLGMNLRKVENVRMRPPACPRRAPLTPATSRSFRASRRSTGAASGSTMCSTGTARPASSSTLASTSWRRTRPRREWPRCSTPSSA
eukprot:528194-Alexandrium_andersonii.AAC.1